MMKAALTQDKKLVLQEVPIPKVIKGSVLVKNHLSGINFADTYQIKGVFPAHPSNIIGFESVGEVIEVGEGVTKYNVGDRVITMNAGSHAEYSLVTETQGKMVKLPDYVSFKKALTLGVQALTAITLIEEAYTVKKDDIVLVHAAAGGVGSLLVQLIRNKGAKVIATVGSDEKGAFVKELGADFVINYSKEDFLEKTLEFTHGVGVHAALDSVGKTTFEKSVAALRPLGVAVIYGSASGPSDPYPVASLPNKGITIKGCSLFNYIATEKDFEKWWSLVFEYLEKDAVKATIHKTYNLEDINTAIEDISSRNTVGRLLIAFN